MFYLHSRLLERACKLSDEEGGGSLTALPVIEILEGDVSTFVPTNVISITDGQILLKPELFYSGIRPAMDVGASVSRVSAAKTKAMRAVSNTLKGDMSRYNEVQAFAQFGASDLDTATRNLLNRGERLMEILKQDQFQPLSLGEQVFSLTVGVNVDDIPVQDISRFEQEVLSQARNLHQDLLEEISSSGEASDEAMATIEAVIEKVKAGFQASE